MQFNKYTHTHIHTHTHTHGDEDNGNGNEDRMREGGREAKKRKTPQNSCRRHVGNGGDLGGKKGLVQ